MNHPKPQACPVCDGEVLSRFLRQLEVPVNCSALCATALVLGQSTPTFQVGTRLVTVDVAVVSDKGAAVRGLTKEDFTLQVEFGPRQNQIRISDEISEHLPVRDPASARNYSIVVGLQLTPEQLELNRKRGQAP